MKQPRATTEADKLRHIANLLDMAATRDSGVMAAMKMIAPATWLSLLTGVRAPRKGVPKTAEETS